MKIRKIDKQLLTSDYNILCQRILTQLEPSTPFGATWCVVEPGGFTMPHSHSEGETFLFLSGIGEVESDGEKTFVGPGTLVDFDPGSVHKTRNTGEDDLVFISLWWETGKPAHRQVTLFAAPPTPNGELHLGHLSGPYLAADMIGRHLKSEGVSVATVCGTDDFQSYVRESAVRQGVSPQAFADKHADAIQEGFSLAGIQWSRFYRPSKEESYRQAAVGLFEQLKAAGFLSLQQVDAPYCVPCEQFIFEAYGSGYCPHCLEPTAGNLCEACGLPNQVSDIKALKCTGCGQAPERRKTQRYFFNVTPVRERLLEFHSQVRMSGWMKKTLAQILQSEVRLPVTYETDWGVEVPGHSNLRLHAWFEMAAGYLQVDPHGSDAERVFLFGHDNAFYYGVIIPALWIAANQESKLPSTFVTNAFLHLDGSKFSTSRRHAIWARESLETGDRSAVRLALSRFRPAECVSDFSEKEILRAVECLKELREESPEVPTLGYQKNEQYRDSILEAQRILREKLRQGRNYFSHVSFSPPSALRLIEELRLQAQFFEREISDVEVVNTLKAQFERGARELLFRITGEVSTARPVRMENSIGAV